MKPLSRIVLINDIVEAKGGATGLTLASAIEFRHRGYDVSLLTGDSGWAPELTAMGVDIVSLGQSRLLDAGAGAMAQGLYNRSAAKMVADWIATHDSPSTVYHLHGWAQILSPSVFSALKPVADRLVLSAHDFFLVCPNGAYAFLKTGTPCSLTPLSLPCVSARCDRRNYIHKVWRVARQVVRHAVFDLGRFAPPVLAIHETMRGYLERGGVQPSAIQTLPNPVRPFLHERVVAESNSEFLFIGRLEEGKGPDLACQAAERAGVRLRLIGDGPMRPQLEAGFPNAVFMGRKTFEEIGPLVSRARALVMPSRYPEPYGLVAAEALWSGLPVICSDTAFLASDIIAANAGLSVAPRNTQAFAAALCTIADDDALTHAMSENAFARTANIGLTLESWIDGLLVAYRARLEVSRRAAQIGAAQPLAPATH